MTQTLFDQTADDLIALDEVAKRFFSTTECRYLSREDKEDVLQWAKVLLFKRPFNPARRRADGTTVSRQAYFNNLLKTSLKAFRANNVLRTEALSQFQARQSSEARRDESEFERISDPLSPSTQDSGGIFLFDLPGKEEIRPAPYKVRFCKHPDFLRYRERFNYVPTFWVEPKNKDILATGTHGRAKGRRRFFGKRNLPSAIVEQLEQRRTMIGTLVRELIPIYLSNFGFKSLDRKYWTLIADINKRGWSPAKIQAKRRLTHSAYYAQLYHLRRRGWLPVWDEKREREVLRYHPAYDRCKSFYSDMLLDLEEEISIGTIVAYAGDSLEAQLYEEEPSDEVIKKELRAVRKQMLDTYRDLSIEEAYDKKIKAFIVDFVERPIKTEMPIEEIEERFRRLPVARRLVIFCEAIRLRCSIYDVLDFAGAFADVLYNEEGAEVDSAPTFQSLFGATLGVA